jgi:hypothetical protein
VRKVASGNVSRCLTLEHWRWIGDDASCQKCSSRMFFFRFPYLIRYIIVIHRFISPTCTPRFARAHQSADRQLAVHTLASGQSLGNICAKHSKITSSYRLYVKKNLPAVDARLVNFPTRTRNACSARKRANFQCVAVLLQRFHTWETW